MVVFLLPLRIAKVFDASPIINEVVKSGKIAMAKKGWHRYQLIM